MKKLFYLLLITLFCIMLFSIYYSETAYNIMEIKTPSDLIIDFNHNGTIDTSEEVFLKDIKVQANPNDKLSKEEEFIFKELAKNYTEDLFFNKKARFKKSKLFINNKSYEELFNSSGYNYLTNTEKYDEIIKYIKANTFYVVNMHNYRVHKYSCKYSLKSDNYRLFKEEELPSKANYCKLCFSAAIKDNKTECFDNTVLGSGNIKIFYTDFTTKLKPDKNCETSVCKELLSRINDTKSTLDIAVYGYRSIPQIETALKNAIARGVKIRLVYDLDKKGESIYEDTKELVKIIPYSVSDYNSQQFIKNTYNNIIMHNKFFIFDAKTVFTGSANLSSSDMSGYNSNTVIVINSSDIAAIYKSEFEQMFNNKFHTQKNKLSNHSNIRVGNSTISVYFSPQDKITQSKILPLIRDAKKYIYIPAFLITDKWLADELILAHKRNVDVKIILDSLNARSKYSQIKNLRTAGIEVKAENYAGKLHAKTIIIDDEITIVGSMNFSKSGQNLNDENVLIIKDTKIAAGYREFFEYLWKKIDNWWLMYIPRAEGEDSIGSCSDGIDNNYDGFIDYEDAGCKNLRSSR